MGSKPFDVSLHVQTTMGNLRTCRVRVKHYRMHKCSTLTHPPHPHTHPRIPGLLKLHDLLELSHDIILHNDLIQSSVWYHSSIKVLHSIIIEDRQTESNILSQADKSVFPYRVIVFVCLKHIVQTHTISHYFRVAQTNLEVFLLL